MRIRAPASDARHEDILELEPLVRRVAGARVRQLHRPAGPGPPGFA